MADRDRLALLFDQLGPNGRRVLLMLADRLVKGEAQYGDFDKPRAMVREAREELADAAVYLLRWLDEEAP